MQATIPSDAPTSSPPAPIHADAPAGGASEPERESNEQQFFPGGTMVRNARPFPSAPSGRVTRSQTGTSSARTLAAKKPVSPTTKRAADVINLAPTQPRK